MSGGESDRVSQLEGSAEGNPSFSYQPTSNLVQNPTFAYKCKVCPSAFERADNYIRHKKRHGLKPPLRFPCQLCNYSCDSKMGYTKHMKKHQAQKQIRPAAPASKKGTPLKEPGSSVKKKSSPNTASARPKHFKCTHCPAVFEQVGDLSKHLQRHAADAGPFQCHVCTFATKRNYHLARHMSVHKKIKGFKVKPESSLTPPPPLVPTTFECPKCPATFDNVREYRRHSRKHGAKTPFPCSICDYGAGRADYLEKHMLVHTGKVDSFNCPECPATFTRNSTLRQHTSLHGSGNTFQCRFCSFAAARCWIKLQHELLHTTPAARKKATGKKKEYSVSTGTKSTKNSGILKRLLRAKSGDGGVRKYTRLSQLVSAEEFKKLQTGNPHFVYKEFYKTLPSGGRIKVKSTYKCYQCPTAFPDIKALTRHLNLHGAKLKHKCEICTYSSASVTLMERHMELHKNQTQVLKPLKQKRAIATKSTSLGPKAIGREKLYSLHPTSESPVHVKKLKFDSPSKLPTSDTDIMYPIEEIIETVQENLGAELITRLKVKNFMCFPEMELKINNHPQAFYGETEKGKSASILALLLGIGYDVGLPNYTPDSLCGWELRKEVVRRGSETAEIELVISLQSSVELEEQYGSHLKLDRLIYKGVPLSSSQFEISSVDTLKRHPSTPKVIGLSALRSVLAKLNILPVYFPLMHLDRQNMQQLLDNPGSWYHFFEQNIKSQQQQIHDKLKDLAIVSKRMNNDIHWRNMKLDFHLNQLKTEYPVDDLKFQEWRKLDIARHSETKKELEEIKQKQLVIEKIVSSYKDELTEVPSLILRQMQNIYCKFLYSSKLGGGILIDHNSKKIGLWVREMTFCGDEKPPSTVEEAEAAWEDISHQKKHMAIIGLFIAFWKCIDDCPFFSVDAHSASDLEFRFPKNGLPVLLEIVNSKRLKGQQFFMSLPSDT